LRQQALEQVEKSHQVRVSLTDLVLRAVALALRECPQANSIWQDGGVTRLDRVDVGLVVKVRDGLMVPVIRQADRLALPELARRRAELVEAVRAERSPAEALQGGATAVSNLGQRRVQEFAPIINPPHSSMLGLGRAAPRPAVVENRLCIRQTLSLTLAVDHRVMDGDPAAEFLDRIVELLEHPFSLFCEVSPP
jgi:pyruvate dehydrogenase E2 component (dihydrolipoamide acetyltransferase)